MKQKKMLLLAIPQLKQLYLQELPELTSLATESRSEEEFKNRLEEYLKAIENEASEQIRRLIQFDGKEIYELSTEQQIQIQTLSLLWQFLNGKVMEKMPKADLFIDLFYQFKRLKSPAPERPTALKIKNRTERWSTGLDEDVISIRQENKERMVHLLISKIEARKKSVQSRFQFPGECSQEEKYELVNRWWDDYRFQLSMAIKSPTELNRFLNYSLSEDTMHLLARAKKKGIPFFVTPYYLSLLNTTREGYNDEAIRSYILYSPELIETYGDIRAWEKEDIVEAGKPNAAGWLLPNANNIHRRYPEVAILIHDSIGRACGGLCAS